MTRNFFQTLLNHIAKPQHTVLIGARQLGKTTLTKQLVQHLQSQQRSVHFITLEDPTILQAINEHPNNLFNFVADVNSLAEGEVLYVVIDEVQYAENPSNFLKFLYDVYAPKLKLIVTGSSAFYIDKNFKDSLAGRKQVFELFPLTFSEFLHFKGEDASVNELQQLQTRPQYQGTQYTKLTQLLKEYIVYGGYPAVVLATTETEKQLLLKELVNSYMKKDALEAGIKDELKFFQLARLLAEQVGNLVNQNELSNTLKVAVGTVDNYLYLLQKTYIVHSLPPKYGNLRKELTKMPKLFFHDTGLRNALLNNFSLLEDRTDKGALFENAVFSKLRDRYGTDAIKYWRTADGNEVDFVIEENNLGGLAYEVKYNDVLYKANKYKKFAEGYPQYPLKAISMQAEKSDTLEFLRM
ncbi:MAG: ATP-binding protein [Bacteroidetes bacterium]|nr:MAG: ATP-binding protein [Bacteroidota bacterium]